ncbi:hypothetical protein [Streptomyces sp. NPDC006551]|uniref:hypothetical protein n=1 Tax=Streptomyces sp. NPDC006551 TaxID=3157178 RepID=UPI0033BFB09F
MDPVELWAALPWETRERVDALVVERRRLQAIQAMLESALAPPVPTLNDCLHLVCVRMEILADRLVPLPPQDVDSVAAKVEALPGRPVAFRMEWDGDSFGWRLALDAVLADSERCVASWYASEGGVVETARALAERFGVPLHLPDLSEPSL